MTNDITPTGERALSPASRLDADALGFIPADAGRSTRSRLQIFTEWLDETGGNLLQPDMTGFVDYLRKERGVTRRSANAYLATVRGRYRDHILKSNAVRDRLLQHATVSGAKSIADAKAYIDERLARLENELTSVKVARPQQRVKTDRERGRWLDDNEVAALLAAPNTNELIGLRDYTIFLIMLHTGLRAKELCDLRVRDVYETLNGAPVLKVTDGKGGKQRVIPYGRAEGRIIAAVKRWQRTAGIHHGYLFRALTPAGAAKDDPNPDNLRDTRMATRTLNYIFERYPVDGKPVKPHDLRRSFAYKLYEQGVKPPDIQQVLGHASYDTTEGYLGLDKKVVNIPVLWGD